MNVLVYYVKPVDSNTVLIDESILEETPTISLTKVIPINKEIAVDEN